MASSESRLASARDISPCTQLLKMFSERLRDGMRCALTPCRGREKRVVEMVVVWSDDLRACVFRECGGVGVLSSKIDASLSLLFDNKRALDPSL